MGLVHDIITALREAGLEVHDQQAVTPGPQYVVVASGPGLAAPHRASIAAHWTQETAAVMAVGRTPDGCRATASRVRAVLTGRRVPAGAPPLRELDAGPPLSDLPELGDPRWALTIRYSRPTRTEGALRP